MDSMNDVRGPDIDVDKLIKDDAASFEFIFTILKFVGIRRGEPGRVNLLFYLIGAYSFAFVALQMVDLVANSDLQNRAESGKFFAACLCALNQFVVFRTKSDRLQSFQKLSVYTNKFMLINYKYFYDLKNPTGPFEATQKRIWSSYKKWYVGILVTYLFVFIFSNMPVVGQESDENGETCYGRQANFIWNFFNCQNSINFFLIFICQDLICGIIFLHVLWGFAAFRINVTMNLITQIRFLHNFIEKIGVRKKPVDPVAEPVRLSESGSTKKAKLQPLTKAALARQLGICITFHNFIQRELDILDDVFSMEILVEFGCFTFLNCLTVFQAFSERNTSRLLTLATFLCFGIGYLYSICEMGSALRFQCAHLTKAAYQCKWCTFGPSERRIVAVIIHQAQRTRYLRGAKIFDISVQTFVQHLPNSVPSFDLFQLHVLSLFGFSFPLSSRSCPKNSNLRADGNNEIASTFQLVRMSYSLLLFLFNIQQRNN